jgi:hypothetical protein
MRSDDLSRQEALLLIAVIVVCIVACVAIFALSGNGRLV